MEPEEIKIPSDVAVSSRGSHLRPCRAGLPRPASLGLAEVPQAGYKTITVETRQEPSLHGGTRDGKLSRAGFLKEELPLEADAQVSGAWAKHEDGSCRPCLFFHRPAGCPMGVFCEFCHFKHVLPHRSRMCKEKRGRMRKSILKQFAQVQLPRGDPAREEEAKHRGTGDKEMGQTDMGQEGMEARQEERGMSA